MYEVIVKCVTQERVVKTSWQKTSDLGNPTDNGPIYQYVEHSDVEDVEVELYRQKVEELHLAGVVMVVNQIVPGLATVFDPILKALNEEQGQKGARDAH